MHDKKSELTLADVPQHRPAAGHDAPAWPGEYLKRFKATEEDADALIRSDAQNYYVTDNLVKGTVKSVDAAKDLLVVQQKVHNKSVDRKLSIAADTEITITPKGETKTKTASGKSGLQLLERLEGKSVQVRLPNRVTRIDVVFAADPLTRPAIDMLYQLEKAVPEALPSELAGSSLAYVGPTTSLRDLSIVKQRDQHVIQLLVPAVVLVLLLILLRRTVISIYLVLSVIFSYLCTFGVTWARLPTLGGDEVPRSRLEGADLPVHDHPGGRR